MARWCAFGGGRITGRRSVVIHDQASAPLPGDVRPYPLHEDADPEARLRQEFEMDRGPCQPREKPAEVQPAALQHGEALANHRHGPFVEVAERRRRRFPGDATVNDGSGVAALLHGHLCDAGQRMTVLIERRRIADDEDLGMSWHAEIWLDAHAAGAIRRRLEPLASG